MRLCNLKGLCDEQLQRVKGTLALIGLLVKEPRSKTH